MAITTFTTNMNIIQQLDDEPNDVGGLTAAQLKAKFDEGGNAVKNYINNTLIPQLEEIAANADKLDAKTIATTLGTDNTTVPTSKAVRDAMTVAGLGDMQAAIYDVNGKQQDIFSYVDTGLAEKADEDHTHTTTDITNFPSTMTPSAHASTHASGGTDAITPAAIGAATSSHTHAASEITSGTISSDRLNLVPLAKGGTGYAASNLAALKTYLGVIAATSATLQTMLANGSTVLSSNQYGTTLPTAGTAGRIFFLKA